MIEKIVNWCEQRPEIRSYGYLFLLAYVLLLRLPSEGLPATKGKEGGSSRLYRDCDKLVLKLRRRFVA